MIKRVEVLLSVYRPEWHFLEEQLNSVFDQRCVSVKVSIRDDSGDTACIQELLQFIEDKFPQEDVVAIGGDNLGPAKSFLELCYHSDMKSDYYAFCDQDDSWEEGKLKRAIDCMESKQAGMYASALDITDKNLNVIYRTKKPKSICFENSFTENVVTGCTAVFDEKVMAVVRMCRPSYVTMHDHWLYMIATAFGHVFYDDVSYVRYRQHGGNVVGAKNIKYYRKKLTKFIDGVIKRKKRISDQVKSFGLCYGEIVASDKKEQLERFLRMEGRFFYRLGNLSRYSRNGLFENFIFKIKFITGIY